MELPKRSIVGPTNNSLDVIEERILQGIHIFDVETQQLEQLIQYYIRVINELKMKK